jgi:regulator of ribosome biosynthesis
MNSDAGKMKRARTGDGPEDTPVNMRKAIRFASKGRGGAAMGRPQTDGKRRKGRP